MTRRDVIGLVFVLALGLSILTTVTVGPGLLLLVQVICELVLALLWVTTP